MVVRSRARVLDRHTARASHRPRKRAQAAGGGSGRADA
jgi:hypothetical protein